MSFLLANSEEVQTLDSTLWEAHTVLAEGCICFQSRVDTGEK